jgi:cytochrome c
MKHLKTPAPCSALNRHVLVSLLAAIGLAAGSTWAFAGVDGAAAEALMKDNKCTKCHAPAKKKKGPSLKAIAEKYKGDASAESKLLKHITTGPKVKIDGQEEEHEVIDTKDPKQLKNLVNWILAQ